jgi:hypothetical protein
MARKGKHTRTRKYSIGMSVRDGSFALMKHDERKTEDDEKGAG